MRASHLSLPVSISLVPILQGLSVWFAAARSLAEPGSMVLCAQVHLCHGTSEGTLGEPVGSTWDTFETSWWPWRSAPVCSRSAHP